MRRLLRTLMPDKAPGAVGPGVPIRKLYTRASLFDIAGFNVFYNHLTLETLGGRFVWLFKDRVVTIPLVFFVDTCYHSLLQDLPHNIVHEVPSTQAVLRMVLKKSEEDGEGFMGTVIRTDMNGVSIDVVRELLAGLTRSIFTLSQKFGSWTIGEGRPELYTFPPFCLKLTQLLQRVPDELQRDPRWVRIAGNLLKHHLMGVLVCSYTQSKALKALDDADGPVDLVRAMISFIRYARGNLDKGYRDLRNNVFNKVRVQVARAHKRPKVKRYRAPRRGWRDARPCRIRTDLPVHMPKVAHRVAAINEKKRYGW